MKNFAWYGLTCLKIFCRNGYCFRYLFLSKIHFPRQCWAWIFFNFFKKIWNLRHFVAKLKGGSSLYGSGKCFWFSKAMEWFSQQTELVMTIWLWVQLLQMADDERVLWYDIWAKLFSFQGWMWIYVCKRGERVRTCKRWWFQ